MQPLIIDVRESDEYESGHADHAINIPHNQISLSQPPLADIGFDHPIIVYCRSGGRAGIAQSILINLGFTDVVNAINQANIDLKHRNN